MKVICPVCKKEFDAFRGEINRALKNGYDVRCSQACSGLARRKNITPEQFKANKAAYDKKRREEKYLTHIKPQKQAYDKTEAGREAQKRRRQTRMPKHVEYCRQPHYKVKKVEYDKRHRSEKNYGEFAEVFLLTEQIFTHIDNRIVKYHHGLTNKSQIRKRKWKTQLNSQNLPQMPSKALFGKH